MAAASRIHDRDDEALQGFSSQSMDRPLPIHNESEQIEGIKEAMVLDSSAGRRLENMPLANETTGETSRLPTTPVKNMDRNNNPMNDGNMESLHGDHAKNEDASSHQIVPRVGMTFESEEEAYKFYNSYARTKGFSIRKCHKKHRADGTLCCRYLVCSNEGEKATHATHVTKNERATTRTCCSARVQFTISREGIWNIQKVLLDHNHGLVTPDKSHMLRSQRQLLDADRHMINQMRTSGIRQSEIYNFCETWYGGADSVPFLEMDCNNYISNERKKYLESKDAQTLLEYLKSKQVEDPSFFYTVQLDEDSGRIMNFFWADGQAIMDYSVFGEVVSFDTTFSTNKFEMPFAPLLGVNHHKQTILFGAALLYDETAESFKWLFRSFLEAMSGKQPETIFTDQCAAIISAIRAVFTNSKHRLCLFHLYQNAAKHLSHVISDHPEFLKEFKKCVYEDRSIAQFENRWNELLAEYNIQTNTWMNNLYKFREKWATIYRRDSFSGDMTSTQRSEGMNNVFKQTFRRKLCLSELLEAYDKCAARLRRKEKYEDFMSRHTNPVLYLPHLPLLKTAAESYTRTLFSEFEEEFKRQFNLSCIPLSSDGTINTYKVTSLYYKDDEATVTLNPNTLDTSCSCRLYISVGLLCKHAHKVFTCCNIVTLPSQYIMNRWTKYAKKHIFTSKPSDNDSSESIFAHISRKMISLALKCKPSKEVLAHVDNGIAKLSLEVDDLLSRLSLEEAKDPESFFELPEEIATTRVSFKAPTRIKGPMQERAKGALEGKKNGKKNAASNKGNKSTTSKTGKCQKDPTKPKPKESVLDAFGTIEPAESWFLNDSATTFSGYEPAFVPPVLGEYTRLMLQAQGDSMTSSAARQLNFTEEASTSNFSGHDHQQ